MAASHSSSTSPTTEAVCASGPRGSPSSKASPKARPSSTPAAVCPGRPHPSEVPVDLDWMYNRLTWWEQIDNGQQLTRNRVFNRGTCGAMILDVTCNIAAVEVGGGPSLKGVTSVYK
ncbi:hypothetical protein EJB05_14531 [Eragrostis curvula]|uniref:Uncharacterized protein n=1 Tax=Eragrostis curvula TaxID=38414 RepID=A0A5J9VZG7_9POAL|nr:hypothetical protein EJB05_14531 [Eragrostis curvula]